MQCDYPQFKKNPLLNTYKHLMQFTITAAPTKIIINVVEKKRNMFQIRVQITIPVMPTKFYLVYL
jgi:hypothetical protein